MKTRLSFALFALLFLLASGAAVAHDDPYGGPGITGGAAFWMDSHGNVQYAANLVVGAPYGYAPVPVYAPVHGARCDHRSHRAYDRGYSRGYRQGKKNRHRHRHGRDRHW